METTREWVPEWIRERQGRGQLGRDPYFITCAPGVEPFLFAECKELRLPKVEQQVGGVRFVGAITDAWRANFHLRTAIRVLRQVARFEAADSDALYRGVLEVEWERFLEPEERLRVDARCRESGLDHSRFIEQRTKDAICDQFLERTGQRPSVDLERPDLGIHVHLFRDRCTVSVDTSGDSLHLRGWRRYQGRAPLAETLAATCVLASEWDGRAPLLDPFCGSGTLLIEAAHWVGRVPPGVFRKRYAFEGFQGHDARSWQRFRQQQSETPPWRKKLVLRGTDVDSTHVAGVEENLDAAQLTGLVSVAVGDALELEARSGWNAWIVTNPPYGRRVGAADGLPDLYREFGALLRSRCHGYHLALLSGNDKLLRELAVPGKHTKLQNGAIECDLLTCRLGY